MIRNQRNAGCLVLGDRDNPFVLVSQFINAIGSHIEALIAHQKSKNPPNKING